jgi:hypothetical protein
MSPPNSGSPPVGFWSRPSAAKPRQKVAQGGGLAEPWVCNRKSDRSERAAEIDPIADHRSCYRDLMKLLPLTAKNNSAAPTERHVFWYGYPGFRQDSTVGYLLSRLRR